MTSLILLMIFFDPVHDFFDPGPELFDPGKFFLNLALIFWSCPWVCPQDDPRDDPKTAQDAPKMHPRHPKTRPRRLQDILVRTQEGPKHPQGTSKTPRQAPRASQLRPDLEFGPHGQRIWTIVGGCLRKMEGSTTRTSKIFGHFEFCFAHAGKLWTHTLTFGPAECAERFN